MKRCCWVTLTTKVLWTYSLRNVRTYQGIREITELPERVNTAFIGRVEDVWKGKSRAGNKYLKIEVSDETGTIQALIFNDNIDKCESMNNGLPQKRNIVIVKGRKTDGDAVFANLNRGARPAGIYKTIRT